MNIRVHKDKRAMSEAAAAHAADSLRGAIGRKGKARIVAATGASQLEFLGALSAQPGIAWDKVELFHLDEYIGLPPTHPASFRRYLHEHLIDKNGVVTHHLLDGEGQAETVCREMGLRLSEEPVDVMFAGIGENAHLAFNDPPADFENARPYIVVTLDEACRRQQLGEGWFARMEDVPQTAISMSIQQMLKAQEILVVVPDARKAQAVKASLESKIAPDVPASILRIHENVTLYLDEPAASLVDPVTLKRFATR